MKKQKHFLKALFSFAFTGLMVSIFIGLSSCSSQPETNVNERTVSFDDAWRFLKDSLTGAENPGFNDSNWRILDIPHDWSVEDLQGQNGEDIVGPFNKSAVDKMSSGYLVGGIG